MIAAVDADTNRKLVMKLYVLTLLLLPLTGYGQPQPIPAFGEVQKSELEMKDCVFDKNAEAMVLFDEAKVYCNYYNWLGVSNDLERRVRIKILSDKGLAWANVHLLYYSYEQLERIVDLQAQTYNLDPSGNIEVTKVDKKQIYNRKVNSKFSQRVFTFPQAKVGSVIEYKYKVVSYGFGKLIDWSFQKDIPVKRSVYETNFPLDLQIHALPFCTLPFTKKEDQKADRLVTVFEMQNIPGLRDEPYASCKDDYYQRLKTSITLVRGPNQTIQFTKTWPKVIKEMLVDWEFGGQLKQPFAMPPDLQIEIKSITDPYMKMKKIHHYVRQTIQWNGKDGIWADKGILEAWKNKKGNAGEMNVMLIQLLNDAGLQAYPVLASTRENGRVQLGVPGSGQFDKVLAYATINDKDYILDATDEFSSSDLIPMDVMFSEGLLLRFRDSTEWSWRTIWDNRPLYRKHLVLRGEINSKNEIEGEAIVSDFDYARVEDLRRMKEGKKHYQEKFYSNNPTLNIDSIVQENEELDSLPLIHKIHYKEKLNVSGDYAYINLNVLTGLEQNPFLESVRHTDVFFGFNQSYQAVENFFIPANYSLEALPKNVKMIMPDTSIIFTRQCVGDRDRVTAKITVEFRKPVYTVNEYAEFQEFYKQMFALFNEPIVIRKNK